MQLWIGLAVAIARSSLAGLTSTTGQNPNADRIRLSIIGDDVSDVNRGPTTGRGVVYLFCISFASRISNHNGHIEETEWYNYRIISIWRV